MIGRDYGGSMGGPQGVSGPANCVCPKCSYKASHVRRTPCISTMCPKCGTVMMLSYE